MTHLYIYTGEIAPRDGKSFLWLHRNENKTLVLEYYDGTEWVTFADESMAEAGVADLIHTLEALATRAETTVADAERMIPIMQTATDNANNAASAADTARENIQTDLAAKANKDDFVLLSESAYAALVEAGQVDPDKIYHVYEDEEV